MKTETKKALLETTMAVTRALGRHTGSPSIMEYTATYDTSAGLREIRVQSYEEEWAVNIEDDKGEVFYFEGTRNACLRRSPFDSCGSWRLSRPDAETFSTNTLKSSIPTLHTPCNPLHFP